MLNKELFIKELHKASNSLFVPLSKVKPISSAQWAQLDELEELHACLKKRALEVPLSLPRSGRFTETFPVAKSPQEYQLLAVDGSQVYPDRHVASLSCYLLNIGGCYFSYGNKSRVKLFSHPTICSIQENDNDLPLTPDIVDAQREASEYSMAYDKALELFVAKDPRLVLFDGTLFLWHLEYKAPEIRDRFINHHLSILQQCKQQKIPVAGYISLTKSKELTRLVKEGLSICHELLEKTGLRALSKVFEGNDILNDAQLLSEVLLPQERTTVFLSASRISSWYPSWLRPCFFYLNTGKEIARVEIPGWLAEQESVVEDIASLCIDQCNKGMGYPVALAEAHEQAVIKTADRDFFYHMIFRMGIAQQHPITFSQKSIKKRGMSI